MKDHEISKLVNDLRDVAIKYGTTQQLRERIHHLVVPVINQLNKQADALNESVYVTPADLLALAKGFTKPNVPNLVHSLVTWEVEWVLNHPDGYDSFQHQIRVITNIIKRYESNYNKTIEKLSVNKSFLQAWDKWWDTKTTGAEWKMKELRDTTV